MAESDTADIRSVRRPKFTVVIPTYRRARLLEDALASVLQQRRPADQVVVISDGPDADARSVAARSGVEFLEVPHGGVACGAAVGEALGGQRHPAGLGAGEHGVASGTGKRR